MLITIRGKLGGKTEDPKEGYLSLYSGGLFRGDQAISRKEMALVLDRMLTSFDQRGLNLNKTDLQELSFLAKNFKKSFSELETRLNEDKGTLGRVDDEQKSINHDLTKLNEELKEEVKVLRSQQMFMWAGIGVAAIGSAALVALFVK